MKQGNLILRIIGWTLIPFIMLAVMVAKETNSNIKGIVTGIISAFVLIGVYGSASSRTETETTKINTLEKNIVTLESKLSAKDKELASFKNTQTDIVTIEPTTTPELTPTPTENQTPTETPIPTVEITPTEKAKPTPKPTAKPVEKPKTPSAVVTLTSARKTLNNTHVGHEWSYEVTVNGKSLSLGQSVNVSGANITAEATATEDDTIPDVGTSSMKLKEGKNVLKVTVTENRGRYSGESEIWEFVINANFK